MNQNDLRWLGGFFDGEGFVSFSQGSPSIGINNTSPLAISRCLSTLRINGIDAKMLERKKPSKVSKKIRWDVYVNKADEAIQMAKLLHPYVHGKKEQLNLMIKYEDDRKNAKAYHEKMQLLNQTSFIIIKDLETLKQKLKNESDIITSINLMDDNNTKIDIDDFCDEYYFAGVFDAEGTVGINKRENKYVDTDRFTPFVSFVNTNKKILSCCCSTLKNKEIGFFIATRDKQKRNRVRWDVKTSGIKRVISLAEKIMDKTTVKTQQLNLIYSYCNARLKEPKSINDIGLSFKASIEALNK